MKLQVHIERLVLEGLPVTSSHGPLIQQAVEKELARLLETRGLSDELRSGGAVPQVAAGSLQFGTDQRPAGLGQGIARAVHQGIGQPQKGRMPR
jgi:hypothetical protein